MTNSIWTDFLHLFYPRLCLLCEELLVEGEEQICLNHMLFMSLKRAVMCSN